VFQRRVRDYEPLLEALEEAPDIDIKHKGGPETIESFPESTGVLLEYDALIVSDLSRGTLTPHFYPDAIPGPNKLRILKEFVESGGGLLYCGGWMNSRATRGPETSRVRRSKTSSRLRQPGFDDRVERPEGSRNDDAGDYHPALEGFDHRTLPPVYGYNRTGPVENDAELHATVGDDPLIATGEYGEGRTFVCTSDPGIKWGIDHVDWDSYQQF